MNEQALSIMDQSSVRRFFYRRKVLVVGADGFLGLNCVRALNQLEAEVSILTRQVSPRAASYSRRVFHGDLKDRPLVRSSIEGHEIVFDLAGLSGAVDSNRDPENHLDEECRSQLNLVRACAEARSLPVVIFCSSRLVYGKPAYLPVDESHPVSPQSIYAAHKLTVEGYLSVFGHTHGLPYCIVRLSNPYGPYQPLRSKGYGILNQFIRSAARREAIRIYGDGHQERDYLYVDDVIIAFLLCAMHRDSYNQIFNLGGRQSISVRFAAQEIARLAGGTPACFEPWPKEYQAVETGDYRTDTTKIQSCLQLPPQTSFEEGITRTLDYYRKQMHTARAANADSDLIFAHSMR